MKLTIKQLRSGQNRMTQDDLADILHVSRATMFRIEKDPKSMKVETAIKIAETFGVTLNDIFFGE